MNNFNETTPVVLLTVGQLLSLFNSKEQPTTTQNNSVTENANLIFGVEALSTLLRCSKPTTAKLIKSGQISFARTGRRYIFNRDTILSELGNAKTV